MGLAVTFRLAAALATAIPPPPAPPPEPALTAVSRKLVVDEAAAAVDATYQDAAKGAAMAADLRARLARGGFDGARTPADLAVELTARLRSTSHDLHLGVSDPLRPPAAADFTPPPPSQAGFGRVELTPEGVGYIRMVAFPPISIFRPAADALLPRLKAARAVVIDLRSSLGGDPHSAAYLDAVFDARARAGLDDMIVRIPGRWRTRKEPITAPRPPFTLPDVKLYVLVGPKTFSAPEQAAYDLKALRRATLVGERTRGGANPNDRAGLAANLGMSVPYGRTVNRITHANWEGVGVSPDVSAPAADALRHVLSDLATGQDWPPGRPAALAALAAALEAPYALPNPPLAAAEARLRESLIRRAAGLVVEADFPNDLDPGEPPPPAVMRRWGPLLSVTPKAGPTLYGERHFQAVFRSASTTWAIHVLPDGTPGPIAFEGTAFATPVVGSTLTAAGEGLLDSGQASHRECYRLVDLQARVRSVCVRPGEVKRLRVGWGETACRAADRAPPSFPCRPPALFGAVLLTEAGFASSPGAAP